MTALEGSSALGNLSGPMSAAGNMAGQLGNWIPQTASGGFGLPSWSQISQFGQGILNPQSPFTPGGGMPGFGELAKYFLQTEGHNALMGGLGGGGSRGFAQLPPPMQRPQLKPAPSLKPGMPKDTLGGFFGTL